MPREASYSIANKGFATSFIESELPTQFCLVMKNRFINATGGAEKRQGIARLGTVVGGLPNLTGVHELVQKDGTEILMVSGGGSIWRYDSGVWTSVKTGLNSSAVLKSFQMNDKLIFVNGVDRNFYTTDGATFPELISVITSGTGSTGTDTTQLVDSDITNWVTTTDVVVNDLIYDQTASAYGIITTLTTATATHTAIASTATGIGKSDKNAAVNDRYTIIDLVELNVVPTDGDNDNIATLGTGTNTNTVIVSAVVDWTKTEIRVGDYIYNTTRTAVTQVTAISTAQLLCVPITGQVANDSILLFKSAMPIAVNGTTHFGRAYYVDQRDSTKIRISGAENPQDMTTDAGTLDSTTLSYSAMQPSGDTIVALTSFQRFLAISGKRFITLFEGKTPVADTSATTTAFTIVGVFPQGAASKDSVVSIGNDLAFLGVDGVQSIAIVSQGSNLGRANLSEQIKNTLRTQVANTDQTQIIGFHYPRRSWLCYKIGSQIYVYNYTAFFAEQRGNPVAIVSQGGSWSLFDGKFAQQNAYYVRRNGTLICVGPSGNVYQFDQNTYDDDGQNISTQYQTGWLTEDEPQRSRRTKMGHYIRPIFDAGANIVYTITAEAGFDDESGDTISFAASGASHPIGVAVIGRDEVGQSGIADIKYPLRWRGREVRLTITTDDQLGPDILTRFTMEITEHGKR